MRVVGGEWGSRRLQPPRGRRLRPTSERLRETLFDILGPAIAEGGFVDAFAGTGAMGMEAFSRGARPVVWIEGAAPAARLLRSNLSALGAGSDAQAIVLERRLPAALETLAQMEPLRRAGGAQFFFLDPPYADTRAVEQTLLALARNRGVLADNGRVIVEAGARAQLPEELGGWRLQRRHRQGDSQLAFFAAAY